MEVETEPKAGWTSLVSQNTHGKSILKSQGTSVHLLRMPAKMWDLLCTQCWGTN